MKSIKIVSFLFILITLFNNIEGGLILCAECLAAQPGVCATILEMCLAYIALPPLWLACVGGLLTGDGIVCLGLCALPGG